ncbi:MAG: glucose-6-phosphate isomerase [Planctomycetota bacterium]|nr:glucose-6-phosphate isomerase [Planctomycetota bacterium]
MSQSLSVDLSGCWLGEFGITQSQFAALASRLEAARDETVLTDLELMESGEIPAEKQPLDGGFYRLPELLLEQYRQDRQGSELTQILDVARQLQASSDAVVILGIGGSYMGAKAILDCCCEPYYNEFLPEQRGGRPRIYFEGNSLDNDALQALFARLSGSRWSVVVISKSGGTLETAVAFRLFLESLEQQFPEEVSQRVVPVTGAEGKLDSLAQSLNCESVFRVPDGVGGRFSVLSPVGLVPAACMGVDVVQLLNGAAAMNEVFRTAPADQNPVLQYAGAAHLLEQVRGGDIRVLSVWSKALESAGLWYDQLLAESLGKAEIGATPVTAVNTRDLHSRAQQHQEGRRNKIIVNVMTQSVRTDRLQVPRRKSDDDELNQLTGTAVTELLSAAYEGTNQALKQAERPVIDIELPSTDAFSLGQYFQMMMLATVVEGRLLGINPYGQPGVEAYKSNMKALLGITEPNKEQTR